MGEVRPQHMCLASYFARVSAAERRKDENALWEPLFSGPAGPAFSGGLYCPAVHPNVHRNVHRNVHLGWTLRWTLRWTLGWTLHRFCVLQDLARHREINGPLGTHKSPQWHSAIPEGPTTLVAHIIQSIFLSTCKWTEIRTEFVFQRAFLFGGVFFRGVFFFFFLVQHFFFKNLKLLF